MVSKQKQLVFSMNKKLEALNRIDDGDELLTKIAAEFSLGTSTVSD